MGSVARLLKEYGFEVKRLWRGRYEVKNLNLKWEHTFANANDLWRWTYMAVMDGVDSTMPLPSGSAPALQSGSV